MGIKHAKISLLSNNGDPNQVQPSDWNADHIVQGAIDLSAANPVTVNDLIVNGRFGLIPNTALAFSATPAFNVSHNASYSMTLLGNVTSSSTVGSPLNGSILSLTLVQDAVGGRTFAFPGNFVFPVGFTFDTSALDTNALTFKYDGTNWNLVANTSGAGGSGTPGGNTNDLQKKTGGSFAASSLNDDGVTLKVGSDSQFRGVNPWIDIRSFGARSISGSAPAANCTMTAGSAVATLSAASTFQNGDGVLCRGAGATLTLSTPAAPTVTAVNNSSLLGTAQVVANTGGSSTDTYQIIAVGSDRSFTPASTATTITNGSTTKGAVSIGLTSWTRSGNIVTITTASPHGLVTGALVSITGGSATLLGNYNITVTGASTFTFTQQYDTTAGAQTSGTGGTVTAYFGNHISWTPVANAFQYVVYRTSAPAKVVCISYPDPIIGNLIGVDPLNAQCDDWGDTITAAPQLPAWAPATPPGSGKNGDLVSTIISGGGGTTVTLGATATNSVVAQPFVFDNCPNIQNSFGTSANASSVYIPTTTAGGSGNFITSSVCQLSGTVNVVQAGNWRANDTIVLGGSFNRWQGSPVTPNVGGQTSFSWNRLPSITSGTAYPIVWSPSASSTLDMSYIAIRHDSANQGMGMLLDGQNIPATQLDHVQFMMQGTDAYGEGLVIRNNINGGGNWNFRFLQFFGGGNPTQAPLMQATQAFAPFSIDKIFLFRRGLYLGAATTGITGRIRDLYIQGGVNPTITIGNTATSATVGVGISIDNVIHDTTIQPLVNYTPKLNGSIRVSNSTAFIQVAGPGGIAVNGTSADGYGASEGSPVQVLSLDGNINTSVVQNVQKTLNTSTVIGNKYKMAVGSLAQAAPTCSVSAGGTVTTGSYTFTVAPVFSDNSEGPMSAASPTCTTTGGNQTITITWNTIPNAIGYDLYTNGFSFQCSPPWVAGGASTSYVWSGAAICGQSAPQTSAGGPVYMEASKIGAPQVTVNSADGGGRVNLTMPTGTAARAQNYPDAAGTFLLDTTATSAAGLAPAPFDNFNRANGGLGANWTSNDAGNGTLSISSNTVVGGNGSANTGSYWTGNTFLNDQYAEVTLSSTPGVNQIGVQLRGSGTTNGTTNMYQCMVGNGLIQLNRIVNGGFAFIANTAYTPQVGDRIRGTAVGSTITCTGTHPDGTSTTQSNVDGIITSGAPGIVSQKNTGAVVNWTGGSLAKNAAFVANTQSTDQEFTFNQLINGALVVGAIPASSTGTFLTSGTTYSRALVLGNVGSQTNSLSSASGNSGKIAQSTGTLTSGNLAKFDASGNIVDSGISSAGTQALSSLTAATASNSINNGDNAQTWNWALTTAAKTAFKYTENTAATNGAGSQFLFGVSTIAGSTATALNASASLTGSQTLPTVSITPTWNTSGVVDAALFINPTNTASGAGSLLIDAQLGSTSQWKVDKAGNVTQLGVLFAGSAPPACTPGSGGGSCLNEGTAPSAGANYDTLYASSADHMLHQNLNNGGDAPVPNRQMLTSTYTNATTTASNISGLSFTVAANANYAWHCDLYYQGSSSTAGLDITITGPASPTSVFYSYDESPTATTIQDSVASAFSTKLTGNATVTATTNFHAVVTMGLRNGANSGTVQLQGSATGAGTVTVQAGSYCVVY